MENWTEQLNYHFDPYFGLVAIDAKSVDWEKDLKWIVFSDIQGIICLIRSEGKYGLFRGSFAGMGGAPKEFYSTVKPFKYDDVRVFMIPYSYCSFLATCEDGEWSVWFVHLDSHPLRIVEKMSSLDEAIAETEKAIGHEFPKRWLSFDKVSFV